MAGNLDKMRDMMARFDQAKKYESLSLSEPDPSAAFIGTMSFGLLLRPLNLSFNGRPKTLGKAT